MTDIIVRPDGPPVRGADRRATIRTHAGGSAANQAAWLAAYGVHVGLAAKVGAADLEQLSDGLRAAGVTPHLRGDPALPTGTIVALLDLDGERSFLTDRGANASLDRGDLPDALLEGMTLLHVSGYALVEAGPRAAVLEFMHRARARGLAVSLDPGSASFLAEIGPAAFLAWTAGATICFPNADEAATLAGTGNEAAQAIRLLAHYPMVVIKRGRRGAEVVTEQGRWHRPSPRVDALDTTGAGDAFAAAYLARHLGGAPPDACLTSAVAAGSAAATVIGGRPPRRG